MLLIFVLFGKTEQLAKDVELFAQHAGRKSVNMEDVILSGINLQEVIDLQKLVDVLSGTFQERSRAPYYITAVKIAINRVQVSGYCTTYASWG